MYFPLVVPQVSWEDVYHFLNTQFPKMLSTRLPKKFVYFPSSEVYSNTFLFFLRDFFPSSGY